VFDGRNGHGNYDTLKPAEFLTYPRPAALKLTDREFSAAFAWLINSGPGFTMKAGSPDASVVRAGRQLSVLLVKTFTVGDHPNDNAVPVLWTIDGLPVPVTPPQPPTPPILLVTIPSVEGLVEPAGSAA